MVAWAGLATGAECFYEVVCSCWVGATFPGGMWWQVHLGMPFVETKQTPPGSQVQGQIWVPKAERGGRGQAISPRQHNLKGLTQVVPGERS